jgi:O-antigen/teichoic acid export membrane protein
MTSTERIAINTLAQHVRSIINTLLVLYATRLVLQALGVDDFGIYSLVGGVITMLGFITNAMLVTTQRNLAYHYVNSDAAGVRRLFSNCLVLHIALAAVMALVMLIVEPLIFGGSLLNIAPHRMPVARLVYRVMVLSLVLSMLEAPYRGAVFARERIVFISIIDILDGVLKLLLAIWLTFASGDRLLLYSWLMCGIMAFNLLVFACYGFRTFDECRVLPKRSLFDVKIQKQLLGFSGWTLYSTGCVIGRTQGMAVIFNRFFGTTVNAAYGIAMQVLNAVQFVALAVGNAMMPQIVMAEGRNDRKRMLEMSTMLSRYSFLLLSLAVVPLCVEMDGVLEAWLGHSLPPYTTMLCVGVLVAALLDQPTKGLNVANQAIGRIRNYSVVINTIKVMTLPAVYLALTMGKGVLAAITLYVVFELTCAIARIPFLKVTAGLNVRSFLSGTLPYFIVPLLVETGVSLLVAHLFDFRFRFFLTVLLCCAAALPAIFFFGITADERRYIINKVRRK